jgi:hypothetical protein
MPRTTSKARAVRIHLSPEEGVPREFVPLKAPRTLAVDLDDLTPNLVEELSAELRIALNAGRHELPFASELPLLVDVLPETECKGWLSVGRTTPSPATDRTNPPPGELGRGGTATGRRGKALVTGGGLSFDPPLEIRNVVPILSRLPSLFEDRQLSQALDVLLAIAEPTEDTSRLGRLRRLALDVRDRLGPEPEQLLPRDSRVRRGVERAREIVGHFRKQPDRLATVLLRYVSARPVRRGAEWQLELRFSGEITYLGQVEMEFVDVVVPRPILPIPHALLERLLSAEPLATAHLRSDRIATEALTAALPDVVSTFDGSFSGIVELFDVATETELADGGQLQLRAAAPGPVRVRGDFEGQASRERIHFRSKNLQVELGGESVRLEVDTSVGVADTDESADATPRGVVRRWWSWMRDLEWPPPGLRIEIDATVLPGSTLGALDLDCLYEHRLIVGAIQVPARLRAIQLGGSVRLAVTPSSRGWPRHRGQLSFAASLAIPEGGSLGGGRSRLCPAVKDGRVAGRVEWTDDVGLQLELQSEAGFELAGHTRVSAFPELDIDDGQLQSCLRGRWHLDGRARTTDLTRPLVEVDFSETWGCVTLEEGQLRLGPRRLSLPPGTSIEAKVDHAALATSGLGRGTIEIGWDLQGSSPVLSGPLGEVELLVDELRGGKVAVRISPAGGLTITGEEAGLYDARFFNALVNPGSELERWTEILLDDQAISHVLGAVRIFSDEVANLLDHLRRFALRGKEALDREGVKRPGDFIPGTTIARVLSRVLTGDVELADELYPLVKRVTDGEGLDIPAVKRILGEQLGEHDYDYELDRGLRWAAQVLSPTQPVAARERKLEAALVDDPRFAAQLVQLPSAAEIYEAVDAPRPLPEGFPERLVAVAPYLSLEQLDYVLGKGRSDWPPDARARLGYVLEIKRRVRLIAENYGGLSFAPQAMAIGFFLGEVARLRQIVEPPGDDDGAPAAPSPAGGVLGPEDVAVLLQATLASAWQGRAVQLNRRLLLDLTFRRDPGFVREVLVEMAGASPRALAGVLYAVLDPAQDRMREPLDMVAELDQRLGITLPRIDDYLAGGRWAKQSHWGALASAAEQILADADAYLAKKAWLQCCRRPAATPVELDEDSVPRAEHAQMAIAHADGIASRASCPEAAVEARHGYEQAFSACAELLAKEPQAFQLPWFKDFWSRNYEALMVLSVVRNVQQQVDAVDRWLRVRTGVDEHDDEQRLVDTVIDALYYLEGDRKRLKADPLVRLLLDPPPGRYDFTIVSAMGVITEGARGRELEETYHRLEKLRGVSTIRANTATARSLEYNAARIEDAARQATTPWGYIGYSQGCANGLMAESRLLGGTPEQQRLAERLVARNLLFSATNGSAHGTCGDWKTQRAMVDADRFLKHYQAVASRQAIRFVIDNLKLALDSRLFVHVMGGVASLSYEGVRALGRDGQFKESIPTCSIRGVVEETTQPEALEFLSNALTKQLESSEHDTQVAVDEAVGHPIQIDNDFARVLERCDMGALPQRTHHWSPLVHETDFVTTTRDRRQCIYDFPKDRHVMPWVDINARFGLIRRIAP